MIQNNFLPVYTAAENKDYAVSLQTLVSGNSYNILKDNNLLYNPVTGILTVNGLKFFGEDQTTTGLPKSAQTYLSDPTTAAQSVTANTTTDVIGLVASIKPSSANSKIFVAVRWMGEFNDQSNTYNGMFGLKRNGTPIGDSVNPSTRTFGIASPTGTYNHGNDVASTPEVIQYYYIDSPNTIEAVTYQATIRTAATMSFVTNRTWSDTNTAASFERASSNIFLMEIL